MARTKQQPPSGALGYKALFSGACLILGLVVPGAIGYILSDINDANTAQWNSLRELREAVSDLEAAVAAFTASHTAIHEADRREFDRLYARIEELERRSGRR